MEWITMHELRGHIEDYGQNSYDAIIVEYKDESLAMVFDHNDIPDHEVRVVSIVVRKEWNHD